MLILCYVLIMMLLLMCMLTCDADTLIFAYNDAADNDYADAYADILIFADDEHLSISISVPV